MARTNVRGYGIFENALTPSFDVDFTKANEANEAASGGIFSNENFYSRPLLWQSVLSLFPSLPSGSLPAAFSLITSSRLDAFLRQLPPHRPPIEIAAQIGTEGLREIFFSEQLVLRGLQHELKQSSPKHHEHQQIIFVLPHERAAFQARFSLQNLRCAAQPSRNPRKSEPKDCARSRLRISLYWAVLMSS